ncbi:MAG: EAL domain-containing protein [Gammaproteobacteria bacterium]|nr:EAL domain-containing protein [Gammaproteobacteria bacterium]
MENNAEFRIMIIDDNPAIHADFIKILTSIHRSESSFDDLTQTMFGEKKQGSENLLPHFHIDTASQGKEGVEKIKAALTHGQHYSLAFVDIRMPPGWDGIETIKHIWALDKDVQIVICTAYSDYSWEETVEHLGKRDNLLILKKPFDNISIRQLACALTKKWQLLQESHRFTSYLKTQLANRTSTLQQSLSLVKATLESSDEGIIVINNENKITEHNEQFCSMWDIPKNIVNSKNYKKLYEQMESKLVDPRKFTDWISAIFNSNESNNLDMIKLKNGKILHCYSHPQKLNNKMIGRVLNFSDITDRAKLEEELQHQALYDSLTGLPNRLMLLDKIREAINQADKNNSLVAVMFMDLDRFKLVNDSLSHAVGDELLSLTATRLLKNMRQEDTLARLGGDEFIIILTNMRSYEDIEIKANSLIQIFQEPFQVADRNITVTVSIGISIYPDDGKTIDELLKNSDAAMYSVKESGSNNIKFYTAEMNQQNLEKLDKEIQLRQALTNNELFLCYQPEFDIANEKLIAVEALIRWNHPVNGTLLPIDFIPLAEETGLITSIGEWTIKTACKQNQEWQDAGFSPIRVAVNISAQQLKTDHFVDVVKSILIETQLKPKFLEFEITENIIVSGVEITRTVFELKKLGISITLDDFGTGYSSLSYLKKLPLDRLKIDGSFIHNIQAVKDDEVIIRAIIAIAKHLNLEVTAEGVETKNQANFLKKQHCNDIQGFYYSKPLTAEEMVELFKHLENK